MPILIERGHVYIAQPPLYKVKKGKQETYVKDDLELNALLLSTAIDGAALHVNAEAPPLSGLGLESLARKYVEVQAIVRRWARRYDERFLEQLLYVPVVEHGNIRPHRCTAGLVPEFGAEAQHPGRCVAALPRHGGDHGRRRPSRQSAASRTWPVLGEAHSAGVLRVGRVPADRRARADLERPHGTGAFIQRGDDRQDVASFKVAMNWLFEQAKKGQSIQRYKGLGEMNASQLWDTTINPETRRLMQVRIEDVVAADDIFTTLMGDAVEPRREFIEKNALQVSNLDV